MLTPAGLQIPPSFEPSARSIKASAGAVDAFGRGIVPPTVIGS